MSAARWDTRPDGSFADLKITPVYFIKVIPDWAWIRRANPVPIKLQGQLGMGNKACAFQHWDQNDNQKEDWNIWKGFIWSRLCKSSKGQHVSSMQRRTCSRQITKTILIEYNFCFYIFVHLVFFGLNLWNTLILLEHVSILIYILLFKHLKCVYLKHFDIYNKKYVLIVFLTWEHLLLRMLFFYVFSS